MMDIITKIRKIKESRLSNAEKIIINIIFNDGIKYSMSQMTNTHKDGIKTYYCNEEVVFTRNSHQKSLWVSKKLWKILTIEGLSQIDINNLIHKYGKSILDIDGYNVYKSSL